MATINSTIKMNDKASAVLQKVQSKVTGIEKEANKLTTAYNKTASKQELLNSKIHKIELTQKKVASAANLTDKNWLKNVATTIRLNSELNKLQTKKNKLIVQSEKLTQEAVDYENQLKKVNNATNNITSSNNSLGFGVVALNQGLELAQKLAQGVASALNFADTLTINNAKLNLVNDGLQSTEELNDMVYQAANRSRSGYQDMAASVAKLNLLAGDAFTTNAEAIAFQEMLNKSFTVSGSSESEKSSANYQITQALASGALQGDELRAIRENAPLVYQAIADYMGKSKGELKELGAEGAITADIIKNSMFAAGEEINEQFDEMPITFGNVTTKLQNAWAKGMQGMSARLSEMLNSPTVQAAIQSLIYMIENMAVIVVPIVESVINVFSKMFSFIGKNWPVIANMLIIGLIALASYWVIVGVKAIAAGIQMFLATLPVMWPLYLIIGIIVLIIGILKLLGVSWEDIFGFIGGILGAFVGFVIGYVVAPIWNAFASLVNFLGNVFNDPVYSVKKLFYDLTNTVLNMIKGIAEVLDKIFDTNWAGKVSGLQSDMKDWLGESDKYKEYVPLIEETSIVKGFEHGQSIGGNIGKALDSFEGLDSLMSNNPFEGMEEESGLTDMFTDGSLPVNVTGGTLDEVNISDEDLQFMKDIAARDYQVNYKQVTPNVNITFGDVRETADVDSIKEAVNTMMQEELSSLYVMEGA